MTTYITILLLLIVVIDATGDAFRFKGWDVVHHVMETLQIAAWFAFAVLFAAFCMNSVHANESVMAVVMGQWHYALIYVLGRIWLFDLLFNIITGHDPLYMGKSDLVGRSVIWFSGKVKQDYKHFSFIIKAMALIAWIGLMLN